MDRLIEGRPLHSDGHLTVSSLADEAGIPRWVLTHRHTDLRDEFRSRVQSNGEIPEAFKKNAEEQDELRTKVRYQASDLMTARETIKRLERVVQVLSLQNEELRSQVGRVVALKK
jgi:predicted nuclease with TOPRIM domain